MSFLFMSRCVLPVRTEVKRDQTKAVLAQDFFFFFKELVAAISVKQELCQMLKIEVYLQVPSWLSG